MSSPTELNPFDDEEQQNLDMEDPPATDEADAALDVDDLQASSADHSAVAGGPVRAANFFQQLNSNNQAQPPVASNSYPGMAPQSTTAPTNAQANGSAGPMPLSYATMPTNVTSPMFVQQAADFLQNMQERHFNAATNE